MSFGAGRVLVGAHGAARPLQRGDEADDVLVPHVLQQPHLVLHGAQLALLHLEPLPHLLGHQLAARGLAAVQ